MSDFRFTFEARDEASAAVKVLEKNLQALQKQLEALGQMSGFGQGALAQAAAIINKDISETNDKIAELKQQIKDLTGKFQELAEQAKVFYNNVSTASLAAVTRELQNQLDIMRQLGSTASPYSNDANAQLQTRLSILRAQSDEMKRLAGEEEKAQKARNAYNSQIAPQSNIAQHIQQVQQLAREEQQLFQQRMKFMSTISPQSNVADQRRFMKEIYDNETAAMERAARAHRAKIDSQIADLQRFNKEQDKAQKEAFDFVQKISKQTQVKYFRDDAGILKAKPVVDHGMTEELAAANGQAFNLGRSLQHVTAIFDGLARGQRGQVVASFTSLARDSGALEGALVRLTGLWGVFAVAGVGAAIAVGYALEQMYQRFASVREVTNQLALGGGFGSVAGASEAASRFDFIKKETNEYAGSARAMNRELANLPPAAQSSWRELDKIGKSVAALTHEDPEKIFKELVKAAQSGPGPLAEMITKFYGLQDVLGPTGKSLVELAKNATNLEEAFKIIAGTGAALKINEAGLKAGEAKNNFWLLFFAAMGSAEGAQLFAENLDRVLHPLKDIATISPSVTGAMQAQNAAIEIGNSGLNKRIELYQRFKDAQAGLERLSTDRAATVEQVKAAQTGAGTLGAEFRMVPQDPEEERRHRMAMENIRAEAQARFADRNAQLEAARAVLAETFRSETQRFTGAGVEPDKARQLAAESEAVDKAQRAVLEAELKVQDEVTAVTLRAIQERIAAEAHGSREKIQLQNEYIEVVRAAVARGRMSEADEENARKVRTGYVREANREEYAEAAKNYENQLRSAKGNYAEIVAIIAQWKESASNYFKEGSVDFIRAMEDATRAAILSFRTVVQEAISSASFLRSMNKDILSTFEHQQDVKIRDMGSAGVPLKAGAIQSEIELAKKLAALDEERLRAAMATADAIGNQDQRLEVWKEQWRVGVELQRTIAQLMDRQSEAQKAAVEQTRNTAIAQLKLSEAIAKARGDLEEVVRLRIQESQILQNDVYATPAQRINAQTDIINTMAEEQNRAFTSLTTLESSRQRFDKIRIEQNKAMLQAQVVQHNMSKETMEMKESEFTGKILAEEEKRIEAVITNNQLTTDQKEKLYAQLSELYEKDALNQVQAQEKITAAIEKENEKRAKLFKETFDKIGEGFEKGLEGLLTGEKDQNLLQNLRKSLVSSVVGGAFSLGSQYLGKQLAPMLGVKTEGLADTGLGTVLGRAALKLFGLEKSTPEDAMKGVADKLQKAADAQQKAIELLKPAAEHLKEISQKLTELLSTIKGGGTVGGGGGIPGATSGGRSAEGALPAGFTVPGRGDLVPVSTQGQTALVNKAIQAQAQGFLDELTASGYKIHRLGGFREGATVEGKGTPSRHAYGLALDINPSENPQAARRGDPAVTNLPSNTGEMAAKYGGMWGAGFGRPDPMHVSFVPKAMDELASSATAAAKALASVKPPSGSSVPTTPAPVSSDFTPGYARGGLVSPGGTDTELIWATPGELVLPVEDSKKFQRLFGGTNLKRFQDGGEVGGGFYKYDMSGNIVPYMAQPNKSLGEFASDWFGLTNMKEGYQAYQRGEYLPAFGQTAFGALEAVSGATGLGRLYMKGLGLGIKELPAALTALKADESGVLHGITSKTINRNALAEAQKIVASDPKNETLANEVWKTLGWGNRFLGGHWKSETSDVDARFVVGPDELKEMLKSGKHTLGDVFEWDKAYDAYPFLHGIKVGRAGLGDLGSYDYAGNKLRLSLDIAGSPRSRGTVIHEGSHAVQEREGWPGGANPDWYRTPEWEVRLESDRIAKTLSGGNASDNFYKLMREHGFEGNPLGKDLYTFFTRLGSTNPTPKELELAQQAVRDPLILKYYNDLSKYLKTAQEPNKFYTETAGEVEARMATMRSYMTEDMLAGHPPWLGGKYGFSVPLMQQRYPMYQTGGMVEASHPGLTSLTSESRGFAPYTLVQTNKGLGKGWGLMLGILGAVAGAAALAAIFDKDKDKELAENLLKSKEFGATDVSQKTRQMTEEEVAKIDFSKMKENPYTGKMIGDKDEPSQSWWKRILPKFHSGGMVPRDMAAYLQGGEFVVPRGFADGGVVGETTPGTATFSPASAGGSGTTAVRQLTENVSNVSSKMGELAGDVSGVTQALKSMARTTATSETGVGKLSTTLSTVGGAFQGLKSIFSLFSSEKGSSGGGGGGDIFGTAGTAISAISSIAKLFLLEQGGIIPSAEGGMVVGGLGRGGTLSILHPGEMVLPRHISQSVQDMAQGDPGGAGAPDIHFHLHTIDQKSGAQFLMGHRDTIAGLYRQSYRNFSPNVPA